MPSTALYEALVARVERGELPGVVTLIARGDDVRVEMIGVTHFGGDVPMRRETPFRIASMTKPVLAAVTMALVEDDVIDLEEPVRRLLPELADQRVLTRYDAELDDTEPARRPVTVADLLTLRGGFGMITEPEFNPSVPVTRRAEELRLTLGPPEPRTPHDTDEWLRRFGSLPLISQPGERWSYNVGSLILGALVSRAARQPLGDVFRERILEPLGMRDTGFWLPAEQARRLPGHYMTDPETKQLAENALTGPEVWSSPPSFPSGAGGLVSTADDFLAFARMLLNRGVHGGTRILTEKSVQLMTSNHLTPEQVAGGGVLLAGAGWGFQMAVTVESDEVSQPGRYGWAGGYGTDWFNDPNEGLVAIGLTQVSDWMWNGGLSEFEKLAYGS